MIRNTLIAGVCCVALAGCEPVKNNSLTLKRGCKVCLEEKESWLILKEEKILKKTYIYTY